MGPMGGYRDEPSAYEGEDTRLTSRKELSGWYAYGFAAEVFVICGMGEFGSLPSFDKGARGCWNWATLAMAEGSF